jgi:ubiquinone/menaquinone biosynthesis C-methylase UbiE
MKPYNHIARFYDILDYPFEVLRYRAIRRDLWRRAKGHVLDAGVGTGRNIAYYPPHCKVTGIDLSPAMLARARERRSKLNAELELQQMDVCETKFTDRKFDTIIATFLFCVLDDRLQLPALTELGRICKDDGEIHILEYCYSEKTMKRLVMRFWAPWVKFAYGAAFDRNTAQSAQDAGLNLTEKHFVFDDIIAHLVLRPSRTEQPDRNSKQHQ